MARRINSATGAPVFWEIASSRLTCSSLRYSAVRFMRTYCHVGIRMQLTFCAGGDQATEEDKGLSTQTLRSAQNVDVESGLLREYELDPVSSSRANSAA